jgi:hypothetical protein
VRVHGGKAAGRGVAAGAAYEPAADPAGVSAPAPARHYGVPVAGLLRGTPRADVEVADTEVDVGAGALPVLRRAWAGKARRDGFRQWAQEAEGEAPTRRYIWDEANYCWMGDDGELYANENEGPAARGRPDVADPQRAVRATRGAPVYGQASSSGSYRLPSPAWLARPPMERSPHYARANMPAATTTAMLNARGEPGRNTTEAAATAFHDGEMAAHGVNRDHVIAYSQIDRLVRDCVAELRDRGVAACSEGAAAPVRAWMAAVVGEPDVPDVEDPPGYLKGVYEALDTALTSPNTSVGEVIDLLAHAPNNLVFGQDRANQLVGHGFDPPTYNGRIAGFAERIRFATVGLTPFLHRNGGVLNRGLPAGEQRTPVLDATSRSLDTRTGQYLNSSTEVGDSRPEPYWAGRTGDDLSLLFYTPSTVPATRSNEDPGPSRTTPAVSREARPDLDKRPAKKPRKKK